MSASSKKKLRKEQNAAQLTEKQRKEQQEAKKLKAYSIAFIAVILVIAVVGLTVMAITGINRSGIIDRNTVAMTAGEHEISSVELSYYFSDLVNSTYQDMYNSYGDNIATYAMLMGLDLSTPLDQQEYDADGKTWADYFLESAMDTARNDYALYDKAMAEGFTLPEEDQATLDSGMQNLELYATLYGYSDLEDYLVAIYGFGASEKSYKAYTERSAIAGAYYEAYSESLTYDDAAIREYEADKYDQFSSFTYASVYLPYTDFLTGGTTSESGSTTYTDEERDAARAAAKEAADKLAASSTVLELDKAVAALEVYAEEEEEVTSDAHERVLYASVTETIRDWVSDSSRKENDITVIPYEGTTTDADGNETTVVNGYYVVLFQSRDDNTEPMANVRHVLIKPQGGTEDEETGETTYSDEEWATAKETAEMLLKSWKETDPTEESFIAMVEESTEDTASAETGGLYEDITPDSNYVEGFLDWAVDPDRKAGDTDVVETEYGYHIMYYVGDDELTYRDSMITETMRAEDLQEWYDSITEPVTLTEGNTTRLNTSLVLG